MNELIDTFLEITYFRTMVVKEVHLLNRTHRTCHGPSMMDGPRWTSKHQNLRRIRSELVGEYLFRPFISASM